MSHNREAFHSARRVRKAIIDLSAHVDDNNYPWKINREHAANLLEGLDSLAAATMASFTGPQVRFAEETKDLRTSIDTLTSSTKKDAEALMARVARQAREATDEALRAIKQEANCAAETILQAKRDCELYVAEARKTIIDARRGIQDERLKAVDAIALHTANATRQSPTLPDIIQAVSSLHASTTTPPSIAPTPSCPNDDKSAIMDDLIRRLSALETSANQKQANIDKLVDNRVAEALAKRDKQHQQVLDSLVQSKIDKVLAKQDQTSSHVLDAMIQTKIDKTLAKLDERFEKESAGVRAELAESLAREKALSEIRVKEEERHQKALEAVAGKLFSVPELLEMVKCKVYEYLADKEVEEETSVVVDDEVRDLITKAIDRKMTTRVEEAITEQKQQHQRLVNVIRHDIYNLAKSFTEVKTAIQDRDPQDRAIKASISKADDNLAALNKVIPTKQRTIPSPRPANYPRLADAVCNVVGENRDEGSIVTDESDTESNVPELSDDGYCVMEPSRAELADLDGKTKSDNHKPDTKVPPSPTCSTSTTFDNNGPLVLGPSHMKALFMAFSRMDWSDADGILSDTSDSLTGRPTDRFFTLSMFTATSSANVLRSTLCGRLSRLS